MGRQHPAQTLQALIRCIRLDKTCKHILDLETLLINIIIYIYISITEILSKGDLSKKAERVSAFILLWFYCYNICVKMCIF